MDNQFRVGKTSVRIGEFEIGTIYGSISNGNQYILLKNGMVSVLETEDFGIAMNFFLERVPADCTKHVKFVRKPFGE